MIQARKRKRWLECCKCFSINAYHSSKCKKCGSKFIRSKNIFTRFATTFTHFLASKLRLIFKTLKTQEEVKDL